MILLRQGQTSDAKDLAKLILSSAPTLLPYLFGNEQSCKAYIECAAALVDGQYSATRHQVALDERQSKAIACVTLWDKTLPPSFHTQTLNSLQSFLTPIQIKHIVKVNSMISKVFLSPTEQQLCIGHLSVSLAYQGMGIGKKLVAHAIKVAKQKNLAQLVLDVDADNEQALSFYLGLGFMIHTETRFEPTQQSYLRMSYRL